MTRSLMCTVVCFCAAASAQNPQPVPGWFLAGNNPRAFAVRVDPEVFHGGAGSASIRSMSKSCQGFGTLMQTFNALE